MGLDMYLEAEKYLSGWSHAKPAEKKLQADVLRAAGLSGFRCDDSPSASLEVTVAYWRKASAIHRWFVEKVQEGRDECQKSEVDRDQLRELVNDCRAVLDSVETIEGDIDTGRTYYPDGRVEQHTKRGEVVAQVGIAAAKMPTQAGFFFGSTDYDEYYLQDLRDTVEQIETILSDARFEGWTFSYHASW